MRSSAILAVVGASLLSTACGEAPGPTEEDPMLECSIPSADIFTAASRNAIPALDLPEITTATSATYMRDEDRVLGVVIDGEARAYPFGIMWWHEVVNDTLGGEPILVTYCPLTGSGIAFDPRVDGRARDFGVSGLLYLSNLMMFDRESGSLWNQMLLGSQCGLERGRVLDRVPIVETDWAHWRNLHPNTTVLTPNTGFANRPYFAYPYEGYDDPGNAFVDFIGPGVTWSNQRLPKELVLGVFSGSNAVAYPLMALADSGVSFVVNDDVGSVPVLVTSVSQWNTARAFDRRVDGQLLTFTLTNAGPLRFTDDQTGTVWDVEGVAQSGPLVGSRLTPIADAFVAFWFAWSIYYPNTRVYE